MKLLFVADGRSPIALNWMRFFSEKGHEVHLASFYPCEPEFQLASRYVVPVTFSGVVASATISNSTAQGNPGDWIRVLASPRLRTYLRQWLVPLSLSRAAKQIQDIAREIKPDLIHAMRVPYEGMAAALADPPAPLLISIWGNDFTLHAPSTPLMTRYTRQAMARADALHTDCKRDARLAIKWGFPQERPLTVLPSGGGVQLDMFHPAENAHSNDNFEVINPRGLRAYVRNDTFFQAVPLVAEKIPQVRFLCPGMAGEPAAARWIDRYGGWDNIDLLPKQTRQGMAELFRRAQIAVSLTIHDGTPNTLLEAMACGCYPIAGNLESIREWITPGVNGKLVDPGNRHQLADEILAAYQSPEKRLSAMSHNLDLIREKAAYDRVMSEANAFYEQLAA